MNASEGLLFHLPGDDDTINICALEDGIHLALLAPLL